MAEKFDPYLELLGIAPTSQPMTLYRLLGIEAFESDADVIAKAADRRQRQLKKAESGPHRQHALKLQKTVESARQYLTNDASKNEYDAKLKARLAKLRAASPAKRVKRSQPPQEGSSPKQKNKRTGKTSTPSQSESPRKRRQQPQQPQPAAEKSPSDKQQETSSRSSRRPSNNSPRRAKRKAALPWAWIAGGAGVAVVGVLAFLFVPAMLTPATAPDVSQVDQPADLRSPPENVPTKQTPPETAATIATNPPNANAATELTDAPDPDPASAIAATEPTPEAMAPTPVEPSPNERPPAAAESMLTKADTDASSSEQPMMAKAFSDTTTAFFTQHCIRCHGPDREEGGLRIDKLTADLDDLESVDHYQNILDEITVASMPPEDEPQPNGAAIVEVSEALTGHIEAAKRKHESGGGRLARRLAKTEYANTVYDLMGVRLHAEDLQNDGTPGTFDTQADALYTTDMYFETYLQAARNAVRRFIASRGSKPGRHEIARKGPKTPPPRKANKPRVELPGKQAAKLPGKGIPPAGYLIASFPCWDEAPNSDKPPVVSTPSGDRFEVVGTKKAPYVIERTFDQSALEVWTGPPRVHMGYVTLTQVVNPQPYLFFAEYRKKFSGRNNIPNAVGKQIFTQFAELMSRGRKVDPKLLAGLNQVFLAERQASQPFWEALVEPMALSMCTLEAMFHFEDKDFYNDKGSVSPIDLAGRLSYFLWRSAPDTELIQLAHSGKLMDPAIRSQQVERMMNDERFNRFLADFSNQWLELDRQDLIAVDQDLFRDFDVAVKRSMKEESIQFMSHVISENLPLDNLIDSNFIFINSAMARHYGIPGIKGDEFRKISLPRNTRRGGLLTQAGILMQTGTGDRSSIVERGVFIAKKMMDAEPPPPPPLVADLPNSGRDFERMTGAQLVQKHAHLPQCASCHKKIDPMGIGLEEFDAIGLYRDRDIRLIPGYTKLTKKEKRRLKKPTFAVPLETRGNLVTGQKFQGANGLKQALMRNKPRLAQSYVKGLLTFANGRKFSVADQAILDDIVKQAARDNYPARTLVKAIVESSAFTSN